MPERDVRGVLFDLDGTLLDTAPDMARALDTLRIEEGLNPLPFEQVRNHVSHGSQGLVHLGFGKNLPPERFDTLRQRLLDLYADRLCENTGLFPGMEALLKGLEDIGITWGIVTNKPAFLTQPLLQRLGLEARSRCVVSGDTLPQRKPHPAPLLHAADLCELTGDQCLYVGDAERDIEAGRAAGMLTAIANWGYIDAQDRPQTWGANAALDAPHDTLRYFFTDSGLS